MVSSELPACLPRSSPILTVFNLLLAIAYPIREIFLGLGEYANDTMGLPDGRRLEQRNLVIQLSIIFAVDSTTGLIAETRF